MPSKLTYIEPMRTQLVQFLPSGREWFYEPTLTGCRVVIIKAGKVSIMTSRRSDEAGLKYPGLMNAASVLRADEAIVEVQVSPAESPLPQAGASAKKHGGIEFYATDLLYLDRRDLKAEPFSQRRAALQKVVANTGLNISDELTGTIDDMVGLGRERGWKGIVAKSRSSAYHPGKRTGDWQELQLYRQHAFVVGGYRAEGSHGIDALAVGVYESGSLNFTAMVHAGLVGPIRGDLRKILEPLRVEHSPFAALSADAELEGELLKMEWVAPQVVVQIKFLEWLHAFRVQSPEFMGMRMDLAPTDVVRAG